MGKSIDERVVEMKFENSKFESGAKQTMSTLEKLKQSLKLDGAAKGFEDVSNAAGKIKMDGISSACETVSAKFSAFQVVAITALSNITNKAIDAGQRIVSALTIDGAKAGFSEYEEKMGSVQTIMNSSGESLETVMGYLEELNRYADQTIYSFSDMTSSIGKFTNAGVDLKPAVAAIQGISNAVALSGGTADKASIAMYNFAQALSVGYVGLTDWKSIELSGMATLQFKQEVMDTAVELGTLRKEADGTYHTIEKGTEVTAEGMRETLKQQWFTSDVLTTVLGKYADQTTELGQKATKAATEVKTFSMMIDTLQESIGSGWAVTWENLIGNFNQATDLFTNVTDKLSQVISDQADARNKFVNDAFNKQGITEKKEWDTLRMSISATGADMDQFKNVLADVAQENDIWVQDLVKQYGSLEESMKSGWLTSDILEQTVTRIQKLGDVNPEFSKLASAVSTANKPFQDLRNELNEISGRTHVVNGLTNIFKALSAVLKPVKEAFQDIFPPKTGKDLKDALAGFEEFTEKLIITDETAEQIKTTFTGFFKVIKSGIETVKSIAQAFSPLTDIFKILFTNLLQGVGSLGKFFNSIDQGSKSTSLFQTALNTIHDVLQTFADNLQGYIDKIKSGWTTLRETISQSWDTGALSIVATAIERIKNALSGFTTGLGDGIKTFFETLNNAKGESSFSIVDTLKTFAEKLSGVGEVLGQILSPIIDKLKQFFTDFDLLDVLAAGIKAGGISSIIAIIGNMVDNIGDFTEQIKVITDPIATMTGFVQQMGDIFGSLEQSIRVSVVKDFAICVGILAASIVALASIDADGAKQAVAIISLLIGEVVGIFEVLKRLSTTTSISKNGFTAFFDSLNNTFGQMAMAAKLQLMAGVIMKIAESILILAAAMKVVSSIPIPEMIASFGVVSGLLWELVGVTKVLSSMEGKIVKGAGALVTLASSVMILSVAMKIIASIGEEDLLNSFLVLSGVLLELTLIMQLLDGNKGVSGAASMIALASAVLILSAAMKVMATMSFEEISKGLFAIAGVLIELGVALTFMEATLPGAAALLVASAAILVLAGALKVMETINSEKILPILGLLGGVLGELAIGLNLMLLALPGAAALLVAAAAIAVLTPALIALGAVPAKNIYKSIGELAVALLAFGAIGTVLGVASPLILAFSAALLVFGAALLAIGGGLALAGAGLTALGTAFGLLAEIGKESAERVVETLQIILDGVIQLIPNMIAAFGEGIIKLCEVIVAGAPTIKAALSAIVDVIIEVFTEHIPAINQAFMQMLLSLMQTVLEIAPQIADNFYQLITAMLNVFTENIPAMIQAGTDIIIAFIQGIQQSQNQIIDAAMTTIIAFINGLTESINTHTPELITAVQGLFDAMINAALLIIGGGNPEFVTKAHELINSFKTGINDKVHEVVETVKKMVGDAAAGIKTKVGEFRDAAVQLVNGFVEGIKSKISAAKDAVAGMAGDVVANLKSALSIHSPSRVAAEIGSYFGQGFSEGIKQESGNVGNSSSELANSATNAMETALSGMSQAVTAKAPEFQALGNKVMTEFSLGIQNGVPQATESMSLMLERLISSVELNGTTMQVRFRMIIEMIHTEITSNYNKFYNEGAEIINKILSGMKVREYNARLQMNSLVQSMITAIRSQYSQFYSAGQYLVDGFISGINSKITEAANKAAQMAAAAAAAAKANLQIHSPSRVFMKIGEYVGEGFINGISEYDHASSLAGTSLAMAAVKAATEMVEDNMDMNPVIAPVMDLSSVEESTKKLGAMLSRNQALSINAELKTAGTSVNPSNQPATQQNITFTQNNYSPKALSREEIYRQTNNQISKMRGAFA